MQVERWASIERVDAGEGRGSGAALNTLTLVGGASGALIPVEEAEVVAGLH